MSTEDSLKKHSLVRSCQRACQTQIDDCIALAAIATVSAGRTHSDDGAAEQAAAEDAPKLAAALNNLNLPERLGRLGTVPREARHLVLSGSAALRLYER